MPLAMMRMSGRTPECSTAKVRPVRPKPVCTSSAMRSAPVSSHTSRSPCRNCAGASTYPPSPSTGSTISAATSDDATCCRSISRSCSRQCADSSASSSASNADPICERNGNGAKANPGASGPAAPPRNALEEEVALSDPAVRPW